MSCLYFLYKIYFIFIFYIYSPQLCKLNPLRLLDDTNLMVAGPFPKS